MASHQSDSSHFLSVLIFLNGLIDESRSKKKKKSKKPKNLPITAMLNARSTASTGTSDTKNQPAKKNKTKSQKKKHHQQLITKFHTSIKNLETAKEQGDESRINSIEEVRIIILL